MKYQMSIKWVLILVLAGLYSTGWAQPEVKPIEVKEEQQDAFKAIAGELRCPTCTGLSVLESDAAFSIQIRNIVAEQMQAGKDKQEILDFFEERYGPWILRSPPKKGFNLIAWLVPIAALFLGPFFVWFFVWRKRKVIATFGVRSNDAIISEMEEKLATLRKGAS